MRNILLVSLTVMIHQIVPAQNHLNIMTFNLRLDMASDSMNSWAFRKDKVVSQILFHQADLIGVQEALNNQILDLEKALSTFKYTGNGREDGKSKGEYSAIFYNAVRLELLSSSTFWLSETPSIPGSKSWDAAITRIITWAKFRDKNTAEIFFHFNTHFDHIGKIARHKSASILLKAIDSIARGSKTIVTGDFNAPPSELAIWGLEDVGNLLHLTDTRKISETAHYGPTGTFNAFGSKELGDEPIDYIFINHGIRVLQHATLSQSWKGRFSSDHFPVFARILL